VKAVIAQQVFAWSSASEIPARRGCDQFGLITGFYSCHKMAVWSLI